MPAFLPLHISWINEDSRQGAGGRTRGGKGIGEEAELRRWEKRLGKKQMHKIENVFDKWAEGDDRGEVEVRDLKKCFTELGREVDTIDLRVWCDEADLNPRDALSLADFAYAFHAMFIDSGAEGKWVYLWSITYSRDFR